MASPLPPPLLPCAAIWVLAAAAALLAFDVTRRWHHGRAAPVDLAAGFLALPRRYLVDVHHVVNRRPAAARMHALAAGGLLAGSVLLALSPLRPAIFGAAAALLFAAGIFGAALAAARRLPHTPPHLTGGAYRRLPIWLALTDAGGLLGGLATSGFAPAACAVLGTCGLLAGGAFLLAGLRRGPMRHAVAGIAHLVAHPRPARFGARFDPRFDPRFEQSPDTALAPLDLDLPDDLLGAGTADAFAWNRLAGFDACVQCGRCEQACPATAAGQPLNPKSLIQALATAPRDGAPLVGAHAAIHPDTLWSCTTCRACVEACPMMIEHVDAVIDLRRHQALVLGAAPAATAAPLRALRDAAEPGGRPLAARLDFAAGLAIPVLAPGCETDILLWLGEGAYDPRHGRTLRALVRLLHMAGARFAVLGPDEGDSGDLARRLGDEATFQRVAAENIAALSQRRFRRIVTADPHALHVLRREYPALGGSWTVQHHTALLDELVEQGALTLAAIDGPPTAYHDPCYLARYNGETAAPRRLLAASCTRTVEMARHGRDAMCCGGGGGAPVSDVPGRVRIPDLRMAQAREAGAAVVAVGCPGCTAMLEGATGAATVRDMAELVLDAALLGMNAAPLGLNAIK